MRHLERNDSIVLSCIRYTKLKRGCGAMIEKINTSVILVLDPRGLISENNSDVISRNISYGKNLSQSHYKNRFKLISLSGSSIKGIEKKVFRYFSIYYISKPTFNVLKFALKSAYLINNKKWKVELLVASDPWESFWCAHLIKKFIRTDTPIQIQVHGDIANPIWREIDLRNRLRYIFLNKSLSKATSIRCVTGYQAELMIKYLGVNSKKIDIIPVPISELGKLRKREFLKLKSIGFIGRIHHDRGINDFIDLIKNINSQNKDFDIIIAGTGPQKKQFLNQLNLILPEARVLYLGQLPQEKLTKLWKQIGVLVSMAPVESYGRVMREALVAGVPVWATESSGVKDLMDKCEKGTVKILDLNKSASSLNQDFEILLKTKVSPKFAKEFIKENNTYAAKLAQSWVKVINQSRQS